MTNFPLIVKARGSQLTMTAHFPVNAASRAFVDAEIDKVRHCVIPICGEDKHSRPCLIGSAVLVQLNSAIILVTAAHVFSDNADIPLFVFGSDGNAQWLAGDFICDEQHDLAAMRVSPGLLEHLSHATPLPERMVASTCSEDGRFYGAVVGYPASSSKRPERGVLHTPMEVYSNRGAELMGGSLSIKFDRKSGAFSEDTGHGMARKPTGKSGGAIFAFRVLGMNAVLPAVAPKLVGIATQWKFKENRIEGAGPAAVGRILRAVSPA